jgi:dihydrofolate synthase/folylpolyglutamate synthase
MKHEAGPAYAAAIEFLSSLRIFGAKFGLETTQRLAAAVGNPQAQLRFIHVAGTNGKGSVCAMLESIYRAAGLRVGLFTSPHLVSFRERIQINRRLIPEAEVVRLVGELRAARTENQATLFEFTTVLALKFFTEQRCDLVIWETGLGGRLDATNIVTPLASVITNIALDHQQWLGDTLAKIAAEKAGIIKPGVPVITAADAPEALRVIETVAKKNGAPLTRVDKKTISRLSLPVPLLGDHQKINAVLAAATVEALQKQIPVAAKNIHAGLAAVDWAGRLQRVQNPDGRKFLLDGAHNIAAAEMLCAALKKQYPGIKLVFIFGALQDKNWAGLCRRLAPLAAKVFTVPVASERTADPHALAETFRAANPVLPVETCGNLAAALIACKNEPLVVITGSLYLVGEALEQLGWSSAGGERGLNEWRAPFLQP